MVTSPIQAVDRTLWLFEQLGSPPLYTSHDASSTQIRLSISHYQDSISSLAGALFDLNFMEISLRASQRIFLESTETGKAVRDQLWIAHQTLSVEVAKHYMTPANHYGRLSAEFLQFFPEPRYRWIRLGIATGALPDHGFPHLLRLAFNLFFPFWGDHKILQISGEFGRQLALSDKSTLDLGGGAIWSYKLRGSMGEGRYDHMLFSFGPLAQLTSPFGQLRANFFFRFWLDREVVMRESSPRTLYPNEIYAIPDLSLTWTIHF
ncbi:MAG: hypothetical protein HY537_06225 [Deltaproteobacteria bacterium]|nr:hypothetical protein [Deltaproteobacteria bacterium]